MPSAWAGRLARRFKHARPSRRFCCCLQVLVAQKVTTGVYKGVTTSELDELAAETAASLTATHPDYALVRGRGDAGDGGSRDSSLAIAAAPPPTPLLLAPLQLAARIAVSNLHKNTLKSFSET